MTSDQTSATARFSRDASADGAGAWIVSWLPTRLLTRNQAVTAMTIAETVATQDVGPGSRWAPHVDNWASELQLTSADAVARVKSAP